jgi:cell division protein FtsB
MKGFPGNSKRKTDNQPGVKRVRENPRVISLFNLSKTWTSWVLPILLGLGLIILIFNGQHEFHKMKQLAQKREALILSNQDLNRKNEEIYREISRLKQDPIYLEEIARKEFGLVKPDEIIFFLDEGNKKEAPRNVNTGQFNHP